MDLIDSLPSAFPSVLSDEGAIRSHAKATGNAGFAAFIARLFRSKPKTMINGSSRLTSSEPGWTYRWPVRHAKVNKSLALACSFCVRPRGDDF